MLKRFSEYKHSLAKTLEPILIRVYGKIRIAAEKRPIGTMVIMFAILALNTFLVFRYLQQEHNKRSVFLVNTKGSKEMDSTFFKRQHHYRNSLSLSKFFEIQKFKDSLEYYRNKQKLTHEDSLGLIKLLKSYEFIDPDFVNQLKSSAADKK